MFLLLGSLLGFWSRAVVLWGGLVLWLRWRFVLRLSLRIGSRCLALWFGLRTASMHIARARLQMSAMRLARRSTVEKLRTLARHANHNQSRAAREEPMKK